MLLWLGQLTVLADGSVTLTWNPSASPAVVGYKVYYGGASGVYTNTLNVGGATNVTISGLLPGATYYFTATTVASTGAESAFSNEASYVIPLSDTNAPAGGTPPTLDSIANVTVNQNAGPQSVNLTGISAGTSGNSTVNISAVSSDNGTIISGLTVNYTNSDSAGTLTFTPVAGASGTATVTVTVDNGGATDNPTTQVFTVTVAPAPVANSLSLNAMANLTIYQNAGVQTVPLTGISSGIPASQYQMVAIWAYTSDSTIVPAPTVNYTSPNSTGSLTFTPVANALGTATVTVMVNNGSANFTQTFTVTVLPAQSGNILSTPLPPTLEAITNLAINESAGLQIVNLTGISAGTSGNPTVNVSAVSSDNGSLISGLAINYTNSDSTGTLTFTPVPGTSGTATVTVTVDNGGATNNPVSQAFTVTVVPPPAIIPPTLNPIANLTIYQNAGIQTVPLTGISSGSTNQLQPVQIWAYTSDPTIIPTPSVNYTDPSSTATLTFAPVAKALGTATVTVKVNNGSANFTQVFSVTVVSPPPPTNSPKLDPIVSVTMIEGTGSQNVTLTGISPGLTTGKAMIRVSAASNNPRLIASPEIRYVSPSTTAVLTLRPSPTGAGTATITVSVNNGGKSNNIVNQSFIVTVIPTQPPTLDPIANLTVAEKSSPQVVTLTGITPGLTAGNPFLRISATSSNPRLIAMPSIQYSSPANTALLTFKPPVNSVGTATITVTVNNGGRNNGVVRQQFTVTVTPPVTNSIAAPAVVAAVNSAVLVKSAVAPAQNVAASLTAVAHSSGQFSFQVTGASGGQYAVQSTSDFVHWVSLETNTVPFVFQDNTIEASGQRFYRAVYLQGN
jgi:hypothetical protein